MSRKWMKEDGSLDFNALDQLEANVRTVSDSNAIIDSILKANKMGRNMVMVFQCGESGLYYPADYIKAWGRLYGIGLGPHPVSESMQSEYEVAPPAITPEIRSIDQIMHPMRVSMCQMDLDLVDEKVMQVGAAVLEKDDRHRDVRAKILLGKQIINPRGRIRIMRMQWDKLGFGLAERVGE